MKYIIKNGNNSLIIQKNIVGKYTSDEILEVSKLYKYIYKSSRFFKSLEKFNNQCCSYIFSNIQIDSNILEYLNDINVFTFISNPQKIKSLYKIKDKIEIL